MMRAGLVDEVRLLVSPVLDERVGMPALFDEDEAAPRKLALLSVK